MKKGQDFLLSALYQFREQRHAYLLIIGEVRPTQESLLLTNRMQHPEDYRRTIVTQHLTDAQQVAQYLLLLFLYQKNTGKSCTRHRSKMLNLS